MAGGAVLTIAINLGDHQVRFPDLPEPLFALGEAGAPAAFAAWLR